MQIKSLTVRELFETLKTGLSVLGESEKANELSQIESHFNADSLKQSVGKTYLSRYDWTVPYSEIGLFGEYDICVGKKDDPYSPHIYCDFVESLSKKSFSMPQSTRNIFGSFYDFQPSNICNYSSSELDTTIDSLLNFVQCVDNAKGSYPACMTRLSECKTMNDQKRSVENQALVESGTKARAAAEISNKVVEYKTQQTFIYSALQLLKDMRVEAVKRDAWYNSTTPKHIDAVSAHYVPLIMVATGATPYEKSNLQYTLAKMMLEELYKTPTALNLFWDFSSNPVYSCSNTGVSSSTYCTAGVATTCSVGGHQEGRSTVTCHYPSEDHGHDEPF